MKSLTIPVKGMHCANCAITIKKTISKIDGVKEIDTNFATEKAKIEFDENKVSIEDMNKKIEPFGYELKPEIDDEMESMKGMDHRKMEMPNVHDHSVSFNNKQEKLNELKSQKQKIYFVLPLSILLFIFMFWEIFGKYYPNKFPMFPIPMDVYTPILFIVSSIILFWIGMPFLKGVLTFIKYREAGMDTLIGIGTGVSYLYSSILLLFPQIKTALNLQDAQYFDVAIVVIGFVTLGKYLENKSKLSTGEAIEKLIGLQEKTALVEMDGKEMEMKIEDINVNDVIIVKPGTKIPLDGEIIFGNSSINESMITGEAIPVDKQVGDLVIGGTINNQGIIKFKVTKHLKDSMLSQIIKMVENAQGTRAPIQGIADKIASVFVPIVLIISILSLFVWIIVAPNYMPFNQALSYGILCFTGVLIIACPCALGLATPTAIIVGTGKGAENGILIKDASSLERLQNINVIVTDKTGTITKGTPEVTDLIELSDLNETELLNLIALLENYSEHPISKSIVEKAKKEIAHFKSIEVKNFLNTPGKGIRGKIENVDYFAGNVKFMKELGIKIPNDHLENFLIQGKTPILFANKEKLLGIIGISDQLKENAKATIEELHKLNIKVVLLSGDNQTVAEHIAMQVGIDEVYADVLPNDKAKIIKDLQLKGNKVAMVGDGINDAPALAMADVGIAMATGTDIAIESASVTLLHGDFSKVLQAIKLSKFTIRAIKQNLFWAFAYNVIGIPLAAGLLFPIFGIILNPAFAGLAMALSSVSVVSNSLRLKLVKV